MKRKIISQSFLIAFLFTALQSPCWAWATDAPKKVRPKIYDESADGSTQIAQALVVARRNDEHVLLQFGGNWCVWCIKLHDLFETNKTIGDALKADYVVVNIDLNDRNEHFVTKYRARELGLPFVVILDSAGKHLVTKNTEELEEGDHHNPKKVLAFLNEWTPKAFAAKQAILRAKPISQWVKEFVEKPQRADTSAEFEKIRSNTAEAVPYLIDAIKTRPTAMSAEGHRNVRHRAYEALAAIGATSAVPFLAEQFVSDVQLRDFLRVILIKFGPDAKAAVPALTRAFHSSELDLQIRAALVLAHLDPGNAELVPTMVTWLRSSNVLARRGAPMVLGDLGAAAKSAVPALIEASADTDETVRQRATNAIAKIGVE